jgi:hypothetical protein
MVKLLPRPYEPLGFWVTVIIAPSGRDAQDGKPEGLGRHDGFRFATG